jgi:hypothetical protein
VLLGSGGHLLHVGRSGYGQAWVECNGRLAMDPKLNLPRDLSLLESVAKEQHFEIIGGSHMKETSPHQFRDGSPTQPMDSNSWTELGQPTFLQMWYTYWIFWVTAVYILNRLSNSMGTGTLQVTWRS